MTTPIVYQVSVLAAAIAQPILCIFAFSYCYKRRNPAYMRSFPVYTLVSMIPTFFMFFMPKYENLSYFVFPFFELLYFTYFLTQVYIEKRSAKILWAFSTLWLIFSISRGWGAHFRDHMLDNVGLNMIGEASIINLGCIEYIRQIMTKPVIPNLQREPSFWMICATLCYFLSLIPTAVFTLFAHAGDRAYLGEIIWSVNNFALLISSGLYIVAMLCTKHRQLSPTLAIE